MVNEHFLELLKLAKAQNPDAESVIFFDKLLDNTSIESKFIMKDQDSLGNQTIILETESNPQIATDAIDAVSENNLLMLMKIGLSDDVNLNYDLTSKLSITFSHEALTMSSREYCTIIYLNHDDITQDADGIVKKYKYNLIETIETILDRKATYEDHEYLGDVTASIDMVDVCYNSDNNQYKIVLTGFKYAIEAVLLKAVNDGEIKLDDNWQESL